MTIEMQFVHLHTPLFFAKKNWGEKLFSKSAKGNLKMVYDRDCGELHLECEKHKTIIPVTNICSMDPIDSVQRMETPTTDAVKPRGKVAAQASGPHDHVFAGNGAGKKNDK